MVRLVGTQQGAVADDNGLFRIDAVVEDIYKLEICFIGYDFFFEIDVCVVCGKIIYLEEIVFTFLVL